jgi:hypothetical protein
MSTQTTTPEQAQAHDKVLADYMERLARITRRALSLQEAADFYARRAGIPAIALQYQQDADEQRALLRQVQAETAEHETNYTGWSRFWLVTNSNGHIHRDRSCSTCRPSTEYAFLPELSGLDEKAAVDAYGTRLCSVCFPSAPVEWTVGITKVDPDACPGGPADDVRLWGRGARGYCPTCGYRGTVKNDGTIRKHKRPKPVS